MASPTTPVSVRDALIERAEDGDAVTHQQARASMNDYKKYGTASAKGQILRQAKSVMDKDVRAPQDARLSFIKEAGTRANWLSFADPKMLLKMASAGDLRLGPPLFRLPSLAARLTRTGYCTRN